jgi:hypothetical protein
VTASAAVAPTNGSLVRFLEVVLTDFVWVLVALGLWQLLLIVKESLVVFLTLLLVATAPIATSTATTVVVTVTTSVVSVRFSITLVISVIISERFSVLIDLAPVIIATVLPLFVRVIIVVALRLPVALIILIITAESFTVPIMEAASLLSAVSAPPFLLIKLAVAAISLLITITAIIASRWVAGAGSLPILMAECTSITSPHLVISAALVATTVASAASTPPTLLLFYNCWIRDGVKETSGAILFRVIVLIRLVCLLRVCFFLLFLVTSGDRLIWFHYVFL